MFSYMHPPRLAPTAPAHLREEDREEGPQEGPVECPRLLGATGLAMNFKIYIKDETQYIYIYIYWRS